VIGAVHDVFAQQIDVLRTKAKAYLAEHITECSSLAEVAIAMKKGGFARIPFIGMGEEGREGDKIVHKESTGEVCSPSPPRSCRHLTSSPSQVRGFSPFEAAPPAGTLCVATGQPATCYAYVARAY
jgi:hypothetical protein